MTKNRQVVINPSSILAVVVVTLLATSCVSRPTTEDRKSQENKIAAYAMPDKYAAKVVDDVLSRGGNAVDASVAAAFVLAVTFPEAGNIGGGGFMLAHMHDQTLFLDYREVAPSAATTDMYLDENGAAIDKASLIGIKSAGVPGTVAGLWAAHKRFGTQPWVELVQPAIGYAENGFEVHQKKAQGIPDIIEWFGDRVNFSDHFGVMADGGMFRQPELAKVLERIAENGKDGFYQGKTAELISSQSARDGGLLSEKDLVDYKPIWRSPLSAQWRGYNVVSAPPPSSGGFAVIQLLKMKEMLAAEFAELDTNSAQYIHLIAEMEKRVFADRAEYFGDPDFVDVPVIKLISDEYIRERVSEVKLDSISDEESVNPGLESPNTTHFSIVDKWGNAVSNTYTLNWNYGSGVVVEGGGFLLNNEMDDFSIKPGVANIYGVVGGTANAIEPGKRMLSSMSPTILLKGKDVQMVVGTPGGSTIFTSVFQAIINVIDNGMSAKDAVSASRFHHQLLPADLVTTSVSIPLPEASVTGLQNMGYRVQPHGWEFGDVQLIDYRNDVPDAASDPRGIGVSGRVK